ncbi:MULTISPECIES: KAP family P-loop NTPase fold protein [Aerosakkonema]|uniref:KAP family P-loop NTPase fold protein n=1 Tax=Aerosakkonema TaxID=1246629 RepID=UPI0035B9B5F1
MPYSNESVYTGEYNKEPDLNFDLYAEELCRIAIKATYKSEEAFTVGIFGSWGSGKTTLMRRIKAILENEDIFKQLFIDGKQLTKEEEFKPKKRKIIWFNPWKYDSKEDTRNALIQVILIEISNDTKLDVDKRKKIMEKALTFGWSMAKLSGHIGRGVIKTATLGSIDTEYISKEIEKAFQQEDKPTINPYQILNNFEEDFRNIVLDCVDKNGRLIVFIDDLDRCLPENALAVLESLKLYLSQVNCIFFIGLDKRVIEQAVSQRYKDIKITGKEYIEKIIRLNFFLPDKDPKEVGKIFERVPMIIGNYDIQGQPTQKEKEEVEKLWNMILAATQANLRKVEQFIIAFELIEKIVEGINKKINPAQASEKIKWKENYPMLAKVLLIQMNFPDFYDALEKNHTLMEQIQKIYNLNNNGDEDAKLKAVQDKYPSWSDPLLIKFIVDHFEYGKISNSNDWKIIHKLSVIYE